MDYQRKIKIILEALEPAKPSIKTKSSPGYLYHATNLENAREIKGTGFLIPQRPWYGTDQLTWPDGSREKRSYWSADPSIVWIFAPEEGRSTIIRVPTSLGVFKRESTGDYYTTRKIPADQLEILASDDNWYPMITFI